MSTEQHETVDAILRQSAFPVGSSVDEQRRLLRAAISAQPLPPDVTVTAAALSGVPTAEITVEGIEARQRAPVLECRLARAARLRMTSRSRSVSSTTFGRRTFTTTSVPSRSASIR